MDKFIMKKIIIGKVWGDLFLYISFRFDYKVNSWFYSNFLFVSSSLTHGGFFTLYSSLWTILILYLLIIWATIWVLVPSDILSGLSVSCDSQGSTVKRFSPHKYGQKVSCRTFNAVVAAFPLDILGHLSVLCSCSAYPYQQSVHGTFSRTTNHLYGPPALVSRGCSHPWPNFLCRYDQNWLLYLLTWALLITFTLLGRLQSLAWALGPLYT